MDSQFTPIIGKDVIESLTIGMYEDSRFIFREYIQNSADQIDKAIREGLITFEQSAIYIDIDVDKKLVTIEDNATGISANQVLPILQNIALSTKKRGVDKGFRGIGRLGGLAYCDRLIFETTFSGENTKTRLIWDAKQLRDIINNRHEKEDAMSVVKKITSLESSEAPIGSHYFKVILEDVRNDDILDIREIQKYLSMVAPLPYPTRFIFKSKISEELSVLNSKLDEYKIILNSEQMFKGYSTFIYKGEDCEKKKEDEVIDIVFFVDYANDGKLLYWGWHSVSEKNQSLNQVNYTRGLRLRKSNIQIGDEYTLLKLHRDKRFNFYFFGEVHGVHPDLIPNSRRDYFVENDIYLEFEQKIKKYFHTEIYKLCHSASEINSSIKRIAELEAIKEEYKQKQANGFTDQKEHQEFKERLEKKKEEAIKAHKKIERIKNEHVTDSSHPIKKIIDRVINPNTKFDKDSHNSEIDNDLKPKFRTGKLASLSKEQQKFLGKIFSMIQEVLDSKTAEDVINHIEDKFK